MKIYLFIQHTFTIYISIEQHKTHTLTQGSNITQKKKRKLPLFRLEIYIYIFLV